MIPSAITRRQFARWAAATAALARHRTASARMIRPDGDCLRDRIAGMLVGSMIGDAAGGPVEFRDPAELAEWLPAARGWPADDRLTPKRIAQLERSFRLLPYAELRPEPAPYAQWTANAEPGTVTDDTRHKIPLFDALGNARAADGFPISQRDLARAYADFPKSPRIRKRTHYHALCAEGFHEYILAARWVLGERDPRRASPPARLWGGVATNAGQMALLPLAGARAGDPDAAYRAAFSLGFMDNGPAKDINAALVAGLAAALAGRSDPDAWPAIEQAMTSVDPFGYGRMPYVERPTTSWLRVAASIARRAEGRPARLYRLLETDGRPRYYWDAHFVLVCTFAILRFCDYSPLGALQLALDFGHDTDSTAQLIGAFVGAVHGPEVFPEHARRQTVDRLRADYDEELSDWVALLVALSDRERYPTIAR